MKKAARRRGRRRRSAAPRSVSTAMRVVHPVCCGIDVHKDVIVCTVARSTEGSLAATYEQRSFSTKWSDLVECRDWLAECGCSEVCMESTGKYWVPVLDVLEGTCHVVVANPKHARAIRGKKSDSRCATWIADLSGLGMVVPSFIPPRDIRDAREISRYRHELACMQASERNRYQNGLTVSNSTLASVLTDCFGKTARAVTGRVMSGGDPPDEDECRELALGRAKPKAAEIAASVAGCSPSGTQRPRMELSSSHVDTIADMMAQADAELDRLMAPHGREVAIVMSVPGLSERSAKTLLAEIGCDMSQFADAKHLCSWAGLSPRTHSSAGKSKSNRTMRAGTYIKPLLIQCALAAIRCKADDYFARKYRAIKARRGHKKAIIAVARMMLSCIYHMLSNGELFNPSDRFPPADVTHGREVERDTKDDDLRAIELLRSHGYDVSSIRAPGTA